MEKYLDQYLPIGHGMISTTALAGLGTFLAFLILLWLYQTQQKKVRMEKFWKSFDSPPGNWLMGHVRYFTLDEASFDRVKEWVSKYNGIFRLKLFGTDILALAEPESLAAIMKTPGPKDDTIYSLLSQWIGRGLLTSDGPHWFRSRRLLTPAFHFGVLKPYTEVINETTATLIEKWKHKCAGKSSSFEMFENFSLVTLESLMKTAFSSDVAFQGISHKHPYIDAVNTISQGTMDRINSLVLRNDFIFYHLTPKGRATKKALQVAKTFTKNVLTKRRHEKTGNQETNQRKYRDFVDMLLDAKDEDGNGLSDKEIMDEVDTFMFAGHDTTASGLSWFMYNMARHPEHQERCREEIIDVLDGQDTVTWSDLPKLGYLTMCIKESLRLHGPVFTIARKFNEDFTLPDGRVVPKGTSVWLLLSALHNNSAVWENACEYDPYRFSPDNIQGRHSHAFVPFSAGPRNCIGQHFALNELKLVASQVLKNFQVDIDPTRIPERHFSLVTRAQGGIWLKLKPLQDLCGII